MRLPFWDPLPVEVRHLLDEVMVLQQDRAIWPDGERVLIAGDWNAGIGCRGVAAVVRHDSASVMFADKGGNGFATSSSRAILTSGETRSAPDHCQFEGDIMSAVRRSRRRPLGNVGLGKDVRRQKKASWPPPAYDLGAAMTASAQGG